jgi:L-asparaginase
MDSAALRILVTGGTFDKDYHELEGRLFFRETHVQEMLRLGRSRLGVSVQTLMLIDSLEMTDAHRQQILAACRGAAESRIVVTHGTDTMEHTARAIGAAGLPKTIVLTGAMVPYTFGSSDGLFNLGSALAFAQSLPFGTYVAMNGRALAWDRVHKNRATGVFEEPS